MRRILISTHTSYTYADLRFRRSQFHRVDPNSESSGEERGSSSFFLPRLFFTRLISSSSSWYVLDTSFELSNKS